jgi:hypothetical protein
MTAITVSDAGMKSMVTRTIDQAKSKDLMLRELFQNALEATSKQTSGKKQIKIRDTDPAWFGFQGFYSKHKFGIFNTGPGMNAHNLRKATDLSSSIGKVQGVHNNFGEGAKVSALPVNKSGMIWVSCHNQEVNMVVLRLALDPVTKEERYERQDFPADDGGTTDVVNITSLFSDQKSMIETFGQFSNPSGLDAGEDWTYIILCGNDPKQDTTENPYGSGNQTGAWALNEIYKRFSFIPPNVEVRSELHSKGGVGKGVPFNTVFEVLKNKSEQYPDKIQYETISIPFDATSMYIDAPVQNGTINITYVYDGPWDQGHDSNRDKPTSVIGTPATCPIFSGIIYKNEFYDVRGGGNEKDSRQWQPAAKECGVLYGYQYFRVFVHIPESEDIVTDRYRTELQTNTFDKAKILFTDYKHEIYSNMPEWFKDKMRQFAPKPTNLDDLQQDWQNLMDRLNLYQPAEKIKSNTSGSKPNTNPNKKPNTNPSPKPGNGNQGVSNGAGLVPALAGKQRMIKHAPRPVVLEEQDIKGASVSPTFKYKAGEYAEDQNILFINATYPAVEMTKEMLLDGRLDTTDDIKQLASSISVKLITNLVGTGLVYGLVKQGKPGYEEDFEKVIDPACLSTHADKWIEHIGQAKKQFEKESKVFELDNFPNMDISDLEMKILSVGGKIPAKELA